MSAEPVRPVLNAKSEIIVLNVKAAARQPAQLVLCRIAVPTTTAQTISWSIPITMSRYHSCQIPPCTFLIEKDMIFTCFVFGEPDYFSNTYCLTFTIQNVSVGINTMFLLHTVSEIPFPQLDLECKFVRCIAESWRYIPNSGNSCLWQYTEDVLSLEKRWSTDNILIHWKRRDTPWYIGILSLVCSFHGLDVCLSVCLSVSITITHERLARSSPNLTHICTLGRYRRL